MLFGFHGFCAFGLSYMLKFFKHKLCSSMEPQVQQQILAVVGKMMDLFGGSVLPASVPSVPVPASVPASVPAAVPSFRVPPVSGPSRKEINARRKMKRVRAVERGEPSARDRERGTVYERARERDRERERARERDRERAREERDRKRARDDRELARDRERARARFSG